MRHELLSGAGFTLDQDGELGDRRRTDGFDQLQVARQKRPTGLQGDTIHSDFRPGGTPDRMGSTSGHEFAETEAPKGMLESLPFGRELGDGVYAQSFAKCASRILW